MIKKAALIAISTFLLTVVIFSLVYLVYSFFLTISGSPKAVSALTKVTIYLFFLRLTGIIAFVLIGAAMVLGALRSLLIFLYKDASFWQFHTKWTSSVGVGMVFSHLVIYFLYQNRLGISFKVPSLLPTTVSWTATSNLIFIGIVSLIILTFNTFVAHIPGITGKKWWRPLHILNYLVLFLIILHAFYGGSDSDKPLFRTLYFSFLILALVGMAYRVYKVYRLRTKPKPQLAEKIDPNSKSYDIKVDFPSKPTTETISKIVDDIEKDSGVKISVKAENLDTNLEKPTE